MKQFAVYLISLFFLSYPFCLFCQELTPLIYFEFEEGSGSITTSSSSDTQGSLNNPDWYSLNHTHALEFTPPDYVSSHAPINGALQMTMAAWFKTDFNASSVKYIVAAPKRNQVFNGFDIHVSDGTVGNCNGYGGSFCQNVAVNYFDNKWHHLAATYDGTQSKLFYDGLMVMSQTNNGAIFSVDNSIVIGSHNRSTYAFTGVIDNVFIDTIALSEEQISQIYFDEIQIDNINFLNCTRENLNLNYSNLASNDYKASMSINSNGTIINNSLVKFLAGEFIDLNEEFHVEIGSEFLAQIEDCN